jgi:hypothetical protein
MLRVAIIASGPAYQEAAAWAAPTYSRYLRQPGAVSVLLPKQEDAAALLRERAGEFGFAIRKFPYRPVKDCKFTCHLKCQGFHFAVSRLGPGDLLLLVDADTCCRRPLAPPRSLARVILRGNIGLVPDIQDRHFKDVSHPWYLNPVERKTYVNSGVILTAQAALGMFEVFLELSENPAIVRGDFNDQKVINFALGKGLGDRLVLLDRAYNAILRPFPAGTIIAHFAGGAGGLAGHARREAHRTLCATVLYGVGTARPDESH